MRYYIDIRGAVQNTADTKAPADMCEIMKQRGYIAIPFQRPRTNGRVEGFLTHARNWRRAYKTLKPGDLAVYQYPMMLSHFCVRMLKKIGKLRKAKIVLLIHDIDSIRGHQQATNSWKEKVFHHANILICHNERMKEWLEQQGIRAKIIPLGVFDYLTEKRKAAVGDRGSMIIAGNLDNRKSLYIGKLLQMSRKTRIHLYGPNFMLREEYENYQYFGSFPPDELTERLQGGFGLVWDGNSTEECSGMTGQYLKYNNPHKVSLYIACGIPVIIWKQAALADYIEKNGLGFTIGSLEEIDEKIAAILPEEYEQMQKNAEKEAEKLRSGYYLNHALEEAESV